MAAAGKGALSVPLVYLTKCGTRLKKWVVMSFASEIHSRTFLFVGVVLLTGSFVGLSAKQKDHGFSPRKRIPTQKKKE